MKRKHFFIIISIIIMSVILFCGIKGEKTFERENFARDNSFIAVGIKNPLAGDSLSLYLDEQGAYFFLPSGLEIKDAVITFDSSAYRVVINGKEVKNETKLSQYTSVDNFVSEKAAEEAENSAIVNSSEILKNSSDIENHIKVYFRNELIAEKKLIVKKSENLPALFVSTDNDMEYTDSDKLHIQQAMLIKLNEDGTRGGDYMLRSINARGRTSYTLTDKKSYKIDFEEKVDFMGLGADESFCLIANDLESSKMRNFTAYYLGRGMGIPSTTDTAYADVYFNGEYRGNYLVTERARMGENRVNVKHGYILELSSKKRAVKEFKYFKTEGDSIAQVVYPININDVELESVETKFLNISKYIDTFQTQEEYEVLKDYIDVDSFIGMYLLNTLSNEIDNNRYSYYYTFADDGKLYAGPPWDYDNAWGDTAKRAQYYYYNGYRDGLPEKLAENEFFMADVRQYYEQRMLPVINSLKSEVWGNTQEMIRASWHMDRIVNGPTLAGCVDTGDYDYNVKYFEWYFNQRNQLLENIIYGRENYNVVRVNDQKRFYFREGDTLSKRHLDFLCRLFDAAKVLNPDGSEFYPGQEIFDGMVLTTTEEGDENYEPYNFEYDAFADGLYSEAAFAQLDKNDREVSDLEGDSSDPSESGFCEDLQYARITVCSEDKTEVFYKEVNTPLGSENLQYLKELFGADYIGTFNDTIVWDEFPILGDIVLYAKNGNSSDQGTE